MATDRRARQRANRQLKLEQQELQEKRQRTRHYGFIAAIVAVVVIAGLILLSLTGGDDDGTDTASDTTVEQEAAGDGTDDASTDAETATEAEPLPCPAEDGSSDQVLEFPAPPPECLVDGATYAATLDTSAGTIVAELDPAQAPTTVNNFVYLARYHYYDGTLFHRVIQDFVIQGGDPNGDPPGTGGPGYTIAEEVPEPGQYQVGSLVMAKRPSPGTTGAQFFIVTGPNGEALPNEYSLFGQVTEGLDVAAAIQGVATDDTDRPVDDIVVNSITIEQN